MQITSEGREDAAITSDHRLITSALGTETRGDLCLWRKINKLNCPPRGGGYLGGGQRRPGESRVLGSVGERPALCMAVVIFITWCCQASLSFLPRQHKSHCVLRLLFWAPTLTLSPRSLPLPSPHFPHAASWKWLERTQWAPLTGRVSRVAWIQVLRRRALLHTLSRLLSQSCMEKVALLWSPCIISHSK